jgi:NTP pyrophosphatase (non-canonical NTP hydrolase)
MNGIEKILEAHKKFTFERNFDGFQTPKNLSMALSVEVSELVDIFTWLNDKQANSLTAVQLSAASDEIADVFIYLLRLADLLNIDLIEAAGKKMVKNTKKYPIEKGLALAEALKH